MALRTIGQPSLHGHTCRWGGTHRAAQEVITPGRKPEVPEHVHFVTFPSWFVRSLKTMHEGRLRAAELIAFEISFRYPRVSRDLVGLPPALDIHPGVQRGGFI